MEVGMRNLRRNEHGLLLWSLEDRQALFLAKNWWAPGDEHAEVVSSDKKRKVTPGSFYSGVGKRENHNPAQILKLRSEPLDSHFTVGCLVETQF